MPQTISADDYKKLWGEARDQDDGSEFTPQVMTAEEYRTHVPAYRGEGIGRGRALSIDDSLEDWALAHTYLRAIGEEERSARASWEETAGGRIDFSEVQPHLDKYDRMIALARQDVQQGAPSPDILDFDSDDEIEIYDELRKKFAFDTYYNEFIDNFQQSEGEESALTGAKPILDTDITPKEPWKLPWMPQLRSEADEDIWRAAQSQAQFDLITKPQAEARMLRGWVDMNDEGKPTFHDLDPEQQDKLVEDFLSHEEREVKLAGESRINLPVIEDVVSGLKQAAGSFASLVARPVDFAARSDAATELLDATAAEERIAAEATSIGDTPGRILRGATQSIGQALVFGSIARGAKVSPDKAPYAVAGGLSGTEFNRSWQEAKDAKMGDAKATLYAATNAGAEFMFPAISTKLGFSNIEQAAARGFGRSALRETIKRLPRTLGVELVEENLTTLVQHMAEPMFGMAVRGKAEGLGDAAIETTLQTIVTVGLAGMIAKGGEAAWKVRDSIESNLNKEKLERLMEVGRALRADRQKNAEIMLSDNLAEQMVDLAPGVAEVVSQEQRPTRDIWQSMIAGALGVTDETHPIWKANQKNRERFAAKLRTALKNKGDDIIPRMVRKHPELAKEFELDAGVKEDLTIGEHTQRVFDRWRNDHTAQDVEEMSKRLGFDVTRVLEYTIALHDIGKGRAVEAGEKKKQHEYTVPILQKTMQDAGFSRAEIDLATALVDNDIIGSLIDSRKKMDLSQAVDQMIETADRLGIDRADFMDLQSALYKADAGSYPSLRKQLFKKDGDKEVLHNVAFNSLQEAIYGNALDNPIIDGARRKLERPASEETTGRTYVHGRAERFEKFSSEFDSGKNVVGQGVYLLKDQDLDVARHYTNRALRRILKMLNPKARKSLMDAGEQQITQYLERAQRERKHFEDQGDSSMVERYDKAIAILESIEEGRVGRHVAEIKFDPKNTLNLGAKEIGGRKLPDKTIDMILDGVAAETGKSEESLRKAIKGLSRGFDVYNALKIAVGQDKVNAGIVRAGFDSITFVHPKGGWKTNYDVLVALNYDDVEIVGEQAAEQVEQPRLTDEEMQKIKDDQTKAAAQATRETGPELMPPDLPDHHQRYSDLADQDFEARMIANEVYKKEAAIRKNTGDAQATAYRQRWEERRNEAVKTRRTLDDNGIEVDQDDQGNWIVSGSAPRQLMEQIVSESGGKGYDKSTDTWKLDRDPSKAIAVAVAESDRAAARKPEEPTEEITDEETEEEALGQSQEPEDQEADGVEGREKDREGDLERRAAVRKQRRAERRERELQVEQLKASEPEFFSLLEERVQQDNEPIEEQLAVLRDLRKRFDLYPSRLAQLERKHSPDWDAEALLKERPGLEKAAQEWANQHPEYVEDQDKPLDSLFSFITTPAPKLRSVLDEDVQDQVRKEMDRARVKETPTVELPKIPDARRGVLIDEAVHEYKEFFDAAEAVKWDTWEIGQPGNEIADWAYQQISDRNGTLVVTPLEISEFLDQFRPATPRAIEFDKDLQEKQPADVEQLWRAEVQHAGQQRWAPAKSIMIDEILHERNRQKAKDQKVGNPFDAQEEPVEHGLWEDGYNDKHDWEYVSALPSYLRDAWQKGANARPPEFKMEYQQPEIEPDKQTFRGAPSSVQRAFLTKLDEDPRQNQLFDSDGLPTDEATKEAVRADIEEMQREYDEGRKALGMSIIPPLGDGKRRPGRDKLDNNEIDVTSNYQNVEDRIGRAWGKLAATKLEEIKELLTIGMHHIARSYEYLPSFKKKKKFGPAKALLRELKTVGESAKHDTQKHLVTILRRLEGPKQRELFERKVLLDHLAFHKGLYLPFGYKNLNEILADKKKIDDQVARSPQVQKALESRKKIVAELVGRLVEADLLTEDAAKSPDVYYHFQVLGIAKLRKEGSLAGRALKKTVAPFQRKRTAEGERDEILDPNTNFFEAEMKWVYDAHAKIRKERIRQDMVRLYDTRPKLTNKAKHNNQVAVVGGQKNWELLKHYRSERQKLIESGETDNETKAAIAAYTDRIWALDPTMPYRQRMAIAARYVLGDDANWDVNDETSDIVEVMKRVANDNENENQIWARSFLKAMVERERMIKQRLGKDFQTWRTLTHQDEDVDIWQSAPGNYWYKTFTVVESALEGLLTDAAERVEISKEDLRSIVGLGGPKEERVVPKELADQLNSMEKPREDHIITEMFAATNRTWKRWRLFNPQSFAGYFLRNFFGDSEAVLAVIPGAYSYFKSSYAQMMRYHNRKTVSMDPLHKLARDLGVIGSGMSSQELRDPEESPNLAHIFPQEKWTDQSVLGMAVSAPVKGLSKALDLTINFNEIREDALRLAAFRYYLDKLKKGEKIHYGGAQKETVDSIRNALGVEHAAAHLTNNVLGDYSNLTSAGSWLRSTLIPFWSFQEIQIKRWPMFFVNSYRYGGMDRVGATSLAFGSLAAMMTAKVYAASWLWNNWLSPMLGFTDEDDEEKLGLHDRQNPHLNIYSTADGGTILLRNTGALGEFIEWGGINSIISRWGQYKDDQITLEDYLSHIWRDPANKLAQGVRWELKALMEVTSGQSRFPDFFNPRPVPRDEILTDYWAARDAYLWAKGKLLGEGFRARPNYIERMLGYSDPRRSAYYEIRNLRDQYLASKGKSIPEIYSVSPTRMMRRSAENADYGAFREAYDVYKSEGYTEKQFNNSLKHIDPISMKLNDDDEEEFEYKFLNSDQRLKLKSAKQHAVITAARMRIYWSMAEAGAR